MRHDFREHGSLEHWEIVPMLSQPVTCVWVSLNPLLKGMALTYHGYFVTGSHVGLSLSFNTEGLCCLFYFKFFLIVDLQCSVNFCYIAKRPSYTYTYIHFLTLSSIVFHHKGWQYSSLCQTAGPHCLSTPTLVLSAPTKTWTVAFLPVWSAECPS